MRIGIVGDVHAKFGRYFDLLDSQKFDMSFQVGDFGIGFGKDPDPKDLKIDQSYFIRGNHDNPDACEKYGDRFIRDGEIKKIGTKKFMFIGGAWSIDHASRTPFVDWWPNEEISYTDAMRITEIYENEKPDILITHDCPSSIYREFFNYKGNSFTSNFFEFLMNNDHKPEKWFFGHHHISKGGNVLGIEFQCLKELEFTELEI
jgi:hypothetical protein